MLLLAVLGVVVIVAAPFVLSSYVTQSDKTSTKRQNRAGSGGAAPSGTAAEDGTAAGDDTGADDGTAAALPSGTSGPSTSSTRRPSSRPASRPGTPAASRSGSGSRSGDSSSDGTVAAEPVLVLNNSTITGLGARTAERVRATGWPVAGVGNLTGRTARTTLYYARGYQAQALALAQRLPGDQEVQPRYDGLPGSAALTLVVTEDLTG